MIDGLFDKRGASSKELTWLTKKPWKYNNQRFGTCGWPIGIGPKWRRQAGL